MAERSAVARHVRARPRPQRVEEDAVEADDVAAPVDPLALAASLLKSLAGVLGASEDEDTGERAKVVSKLKKDAGKLDEMGISAAVCDLSIMVFQLRALYKEDVGVVLLELLEQAAQKTERLPSPKISRADPCMAILRLLEGVLLICTAKHNPSKVAKCIESLLRRRRLPATAIMRLEAAMFRLGDISKNPAVKAPLPLSAKGDTTWLTDMATSMRPSDDDLKRIELAKRAIEKAVEVAFPGSRAEYFGSAVNGFETNLSDIDCVVLLSPSAAKKLLEDGEEQLEEDHPGTGGRRTRKIEAKQAVQVLNDAIRTCPELEDVGLTVTEVIKEARVPLLKCESAEGVAIDVSFNNTLPLHNSKLLRSYAGLHENVQLLGCLVKMWAKKRGVNDAHTGTLSGYSFVLMVIHYLQHVRVVPNLQDKELVPQELLAIVGETELVDGLHDAWFIDPARDEAKSLIAEMMSEEGKPKCTLHGLLAGFFRYFAYEFPMQSDVISIRHNPDEDNMPKMTFFEQLARKQALRQEEVDALDDAQDDVAAAEDADGGEVAEDDDAAEDLGASEDEAGPGADEEGAEGDEGADEDPLADDTAPSEVDKVGGGDEDGLAPEEASSTPADVVGEGAASAEDGVAPEEARHDDAPAGARDVAYMAGSPSAAEAGGSASEEAHPEPPRTDVEREGAGEVRAGDAPTSGRERSGEVGAATDAVDDAAPGEAGADDASSDEEVLLGETVSATAGGSSAAAPRRTAGDDGGPPTTPDLHVDRPVLSPETCNVQRMVSGRQVFCIEDPIEQGRTLATSFTGAERLVYEMRRACEILKPGYGRKECDRLLGNSPPVDCPLWKLDRSFVPSLLKAPGGGYQRHPVARAAPGGRSYYSAGGGDRDPDYDRGDPQLLKPAPRHHAKGEQQQPRRWTSAAAGKGAGAGSSRDAAAAPLGAAPTVSRNKITPASGSFYSQGAARGASDGWDAVSGQSAGGARPSQGGKAKGRKGQWGQQSYWAEERWAAEGWSAWGWSEQPSSKGQWGWPQEKGQRGWAPQQRPKGAGGGGVGRWQAQNWQ